MEFIYKQTKLFNNLVYSYFSKKYQPLYKSKNVFILSNKNINSHYKTTLDEKQHTLIYVLYKNIHYKEQKNHPFYKCYLDSNTKLKISKLFNYYNKRIHLSNDILIIGKRYINRKTNEKINDSTKLYCVLPMSNTQSNYTCNYSIKDDNMIKYDNMIKTDNMTKADNMTKDDSISENLRSKKRNLIIQNKRRLFLYNLKNSLKTKSLYLNYIIKNGLYLDVEYTNDIYDDFTTFPISKDNSTLFMIGITLLKRVTLLKRDKLDFVHFTTDKLTPEYEYKILKEFLDFINEKYKKDKSPTIIYHWSHADKTCLEKSFKKYPDLYHIYTIYPIQYIDLLDVVKKTIEMPSYSLKYIAKHLLHINYDTECQNGLDAMCSIIQKNNNMKINEKLTDFDVTKDIIQYNKMDTVLLYKVIEFFSKNKK